MLCEPNIRATVESPHGLSLCIESWIFEDLELLDCRLLLFHVRDCQLGLFALNGELILLQVGLAFDYTRLVRLEVGRGLLDDNFLLHLLQLLLGVVDGHSRTALAQLLLLDLQTEAIHGLLVRQLIHLLNQALFAVQVLFHCLEDALGYSEAKLLSLL